MKRKWHHPETPESSRQYWRSEGELQQTGEFSDWLEKEFPQGAAEFNGGEDSRRDFVKLMGASTALAGFGVACSRPARHLIPFNDHVEWLVPGKALYYSTAKPSLDGLGCDPLVVTTYDGRPTMLNGNRLVPCGGGVDAFTQASMLDLYDPDRSRGYLQNGSKTTKVAFEKGWMEPRLGERGGRDLAFLVEPSSSPLRAKFIKKISQVYRGARFYSYKNVGQGLSEACEELYGAGKSQVVGLGGAERILSLDCDFLGLDKIGGGCGKEFFDGRNVDSGEMSRYYAVEGAFTLTGSVADHRYRLAPSQVLPVAVLIAEMVGGEAASLASSLRSQVVSEVFDLKWLKECVADLKGKKSVVVAGPNQPKEVHLLVAGINKALGAFGEFVNVVDHDMPQLGSIEDLVEGLNSGRVKDLVVIGDNDPVFDAPANLDFASAMKKATSVHVGVRVSLTAQAADWHVPGATFLESWGDCLGRTGKYSVQQPMINPLWGGVSENEFLQRFASGESAPTLLEEVKASYADRGGSDWVSLLRNGFDSELQSEVSSEVSFEKAAASLSSAKIKDFPCPEALQVALTVSSSNYDGRFANNSWLQEVADPITKLAWDNAALLSRKTMKAFKLKDGDLVDLTVGDTTVQVAALMAPGHADYSISLPIGFYGQGSDLGRVARG
ncbi:MAG: TAT-variant-translocated molybdopterin oxidoreductase, partial [Verrucomicrobiota bacterium]